MSGTEEVVDVEADMVVAGYGAAGAAAAITAHDGGASVIVLEKQEAETPISSSYMCGGVVLCPNDVQEARRYLEALYRVSEHLYWTESDIIQAWAEYTAQNKKWLESMGAVVELYRHGGEHKMPGVESIDVYRVRGMGPGMMRILHEQVSARGIQVLAGTSAAELIVNSKGEVVGVRATRSTGAGQRINVRARRGVVLATGGFEFDEEMKLHYLGVYPTYFTATPANTGDGVRMALGAGAQLWHMNCVSGGLVLKFPEIPTGFSHALGGKNFSTPVASALPGFGGAGWQAERAKKLAAVAGYLLVDRSGRRYIDENRKAAVYYSLTLFDPRRLLHPRVPSYWIFDQKRIDDGPLVRQANGPTGPARIYRWSTDNREELERGWIKRGDTVKELALTLGLEAQALVETAANYNRYCEHGEDADYNRTPETLIALDKPPYYAVEMWPGGPNTQGGPRRNAKAQVLRADGAPIPRLYSAGELGSIYGKVYPSSGGNIAECIAFGRIAGENVCGNPPL